MYFDDLSILAGCNYELIAVDPPWQYQDKAAAGERGAEFKYPCMTVDAIASLPIAAIAAPNCLLACWTTGPMLVDGTCERVIRSWGFTPKTMGFTWVKRTKHGKLFVGMGRWTRSNPEYCVLATRGKPHRVSAAVHSVIEAPVGAHSVKPDVFRERLVQLCGDVARIELFARGDVGWGFDAWGNEPMGPGQIRAGLTETARAA